jgi:hypothetical protein
MKKNTGTFLLLFTTLFSFAQYTLKGKVVDVNSGKSISAVSIYINNSSKGTSTNTEGEFVLENIAVANFDIVASCVGYQTFSTTISANAISNILEIKLKPKSAELEAVILQSYEKDGWKKWGKVFTESILGIIDAAEYCEIENKEVIRFIYDKRKNELSAIAFEPIIIVNKYLGYELKYDLVNFYTNFHTKIVFYEGYPFFTSLQGSSKKINKWKENRKNIYDGSIMHFMRSLYRNKLEENNFEIKVLKRYPNEEKQRVKKIYQSLFKSNNGIIVMKQSDSSEYYQKIIKQSDSLDYVYPNKINADSIAFVVDSTTAGIFFNDHIQVKHNVFKKILTTNSLFHEKKKQYPISIISILNNKEIVVYSNGLYYDPSILLTEGYWGLYEKLSNLLPFDYVLGD